MPLSPATRRERRAALKKKYPPPSPPTRHCRNCDKPYPLTRPNRRFCSGECKNEFFAYGQNAMGPLKEKLNKLIAAHVTRCLASFEKQTAQLRKELRELDKESRHHAIVSQIQRRQQTKQALALDRAQRIIADLTSAYDSFGLPRRH